MKFTDLGLAEPILRAVTAEGYTVPTPIQLKAIPHVLQGSDLMGTAQTGTGKTAAFALPILHRLSEGSRQSAVGSHQEKSHSHNGHSAHAAGHKPKTDGHKPTAHSPKAHAHIRTLILCPTRELASQIGDSFRAYGRNLHLRHTVIFGGVNQHHQVKSLRAGVDIVIATPGRLLDLMNQGFVDLRGIEIFVLDEADRMLDMGFMPDIRRIIQRLPVNEKRQTLMFSATMPSDIRSLAHSILHNPVNVQVNPVASTVQTVKQTVYHLPRKSKQSLLTHLLREHGDHRTLVFTRTKHGADKVVRDLEKCGIRAEAIHGNKSQNNRTRALAAFKSEKPPVLVATDIASRGIDVDDITHVINFDIPHEPETYVHRIGRTARAGASGMAISFCDPDERGSLKAIERLTRVEITVNKIQFDLPQMAVATPSSRDEESTDRREHQRPRQGGWSKPKRGPSTPKSQSNHSKHATHSKHPQPKREVSHASPGQRQGFMQRGRGKPRGKNAGGNSGR